MADYDYNPFFDKVTRVYDEALGPGCFMRPGIGIDGFSPRRRCVARQPVPTRRRSCGGRGGRGYSTLATVGEGETLRVLRVEGSWVGTTVATGGAKVGGWIWARQVATPRQYQALRQTVRRSYSYQPGPVEGDAYQGYYLGAPSSSQPFTMGVTPYGGSYWRADRKVTGY